MSLGKLRIACIHTFAKEKFSQVFNDIYWNVHQDNPKFGGQQRPPTPVGAFGFDCKCKFCIPSPLPFSLLFEYNY